MLMSYEEAAQCLHTTVHALYQLKLKDKRPFPEPGMVDVEWFGRNRIAYQQVINDARRAWLELQSQGWSARRVGREVARQHDIPASTISNMLLKGLWMPIKRKQYYWTVPRSVKYFLRWYEVYF